MNILLLLVSIISISGYAFYLNNKMNTYSMKLTFRENILINEIDDLAEKEKELKAGYNAILANIIQKESEVRQRYNDALVFESRAREEMVFLEKQISKLKTALNNARYKSKRLADKIQK
jgi:hypothetical protein